MSPEELKELAQSTGVTNIINITPEVMLAVFQAVFHAGGFKSYQLTLIIVNAFIQVAVLRQKCLYEKHTAEVGVKKQERRERVKYHIDYTQRLWTESSNS
jgi:uncharacterized protein YaaW (UPF0174 family)